MNNPLGSDAETLSRIAERAMKERGFEPRVPEAALRAAAELPDTPRAADGVRDMRDLPWTSIDNPESRDLDQIEAIESAGAETILYVGIADVDTSVPRGSAIDAFAHTNTTSVYTGVRTFPMLPDRLSFDLTSLVEGKPRLAMVYATRIAADGRVGKVTLTRALVANRAKLDYPSVSAWLEGTGPAPAAVARSRTLEEQLRGQDELARRLGVRRREAGAIDVETEETRPVVEEGRVTALVAARQTRAGRIIEELMIASNAAVACALDEANVPSIRRVVKEPERWAKIVTYAAARGATLPAAPSSAALAQFVETMHRQRPGEFADISLAIVKLMGRGEYVAHAPGSHEIGHFGLATLEYTHSTAPNRRYVDLVTQRILETLGARPAYALPELVAIAEHASEREVAAQKVERRVHKSAAASLLRSRVGERFEGIVTGAADKGTFVRIEHPHAEGKVVEGAGGLHVGDRVTVKLLSTDVERGYIDFGA